MEGIHKLLLWISDSYDLSVESYTEGTESTFNHQGHVFGVDELIGKTKNLPPVDFPVAKLKWMFDGAEVDQDRVADVNPAIPALITEYEPGKYVTMDGFHRVARAIKDNQKTLKVKIVPTSIVDTLTDLKR